MRQVFLDPAGGLDKIHAVVVVFNDTGSNRKHVRIKDNIGWVKVKLFHQQIIRSFADLGFALKGVGLPLLIKRHDDHRCPVALTQLGFGYKLSLTFF